MFENIVIIIPSLNPDKKLIKLIDDLSAADFKNILIINDGSAGIYDNIFAEAAAKNAQIIKHTVNQGKGRALKTAFNEVLIRYPECQSAITVDADGQHQIKDIVNCAKAQIAHPKSLVMGCRNFDKEDVPFRSRAGNLMTRNITNFLCGVKLSDTQTGLRGIPAAHMPFFLSLSGERFEYETQMLLSAKENDISFYEVPIETVYIEENKSSHFNPLVDSYKIYKLFSKYLLSSISCFVIDIVLFTLFVTLLKPTGFQYGILTATVLARVISAVINYLINKKRVFCDKSSDKNSFTKYIILSISIMLASGGLVSVLYQLLNINESIIKVVVDTVLFFFTFVIQRDWVFKERKKF